MSTVVSDTWREKRCAFNLLQFILNWACAGVTYENVMLQFFFFFITDLFFKFIFTCLPAANFTLRQKYTYNDNQIEQYAVYTITFILFEPNCREMC